MTGGASTGGTDGGSIACSAILCEDFESGTLDPTVWTQHSNNGSVALQSSKVAHGQHAAHFHMDPGKAHAYISESKTYPALDREAYGRMYFRLEPAGPPSHTVFVSGGIMDGTAHLELGNYDGGWQLTFWSPNKGEDIGVGTAKYPVNQWSCIEWHFNDRPGEIEVWVDGVSRGSKTRTENDWTDGFKEIAFGLYLFSSVDHATDLYLDDIVLNNQRVGCLPP
ncbi:MAG: hypothetical protein SFV15_20730 [Polyangiaceae bacterium]|nr:hypothetical protein [Polyangiaceae bacterium]